MNQNTPPTEYFALSGFLEALKNLPPVASVTYNESTYTFVARDANGPFALWKLVASESAKFVRGKAGEPISLQKVAQLLRHLTLRADARNLLDGKIATFIDRYDIGTWRFAALAPVADPNAYLRRALVVDTETTQTEWIDLPHDLEASMPFFHRGQGTPSTFIDIRFVYSLADGRLKVGYKVPHFEENRRAAADAVVALVEDAIGGKVVRIAQNVGTERKADPLDGLLATVHMEGNEPSLGFSVSKRNDGDDGPIYSTYLVRADDGMEFAGGANDLEDVVYNAFHAGRDYERKIGPVGALAAALNATVRPDAAIDAIRSLSDGGVWIEEAWMHLMDEDQDPGDGELRTTSYRVRVEREDEKYFPFRFTIEVQNRRDGAWESLNLPDSDKPMVFTTIEEAVPDVLRFCRSYCDAFGTESLTATAKFREVYGVTDEHLQTGVLSPLMAEEYARRTAAGI